MNCNVPGEVPSIAVQAVSKDLNQHVFYCSKHGRIEIDKALSEQKKELENFKPNKREKRKSYQPDYHLHQIQKNIQYDYAI